MSQYSSLASRAADWWDSYGVFVWSGAVLVTIVLGWIGFARHFHDRSFWDHTYLALQLFVLESGDVRPPSPWELDVARVLAPILAALGVVGAATLVVRAIRDQQWRLRGIRDHTVICGLGERGSALSMALCPARKERQPGARRERVAVVETGANPEDIEACRERGALIITGDARDPAVLNRARIRRACKAVILCGADEVNAEVAMTMIDARAAYGTEPLEIIVQIADPEFRALIERTAETQGWGVDGPSCSLRAINVFDEVARLMAEKAGFPAVRTAGSWVILAGLGVLGKSVLCEIATLYEEWREAEGVGERLRVKILDRAASQKIRELNVSREPHGRPLEETLDLRFWEGDISGPDFDLGDFRDGINEVSAAFICVHNDHLALTTARTLRDMYETPPIVVRMSRQGVGLARLLEGLNNVTPIGVGDACTGFLLEPHRPFPSRIAATAA